MLSLFDGDRIWCRFGSPDPAERQAEMFSASLLMPRDELRAAMPQHPWRGWPHIYRLADAFLVNVTPMKTRLEKLGWMHLDDHGTPVSGAKPVPGQRPLF
jgi:Zn-dependent peptidase ImmA (M78 family)